MHGFDDVERAKATFDTLCKTFDSHNWSYEKDEEKMTVYCEGTGEDLPIDISANVDAERMIVIIISRLPFVIKEEKRLEIAIAISAINNILSLGCFDYDIKTGKIYFRIANSFIESTMSETMFSYLIMASFKIIDDFNDKLMMIGKGMYSIEQFLASLNN